MPSTATECDAAMADDNPVYRETTNRNQQRRNPRFPNASVWTDAKRQEHRDDRDSTIEGAGLVTDRMIDAHMAGDR